MDSRLDEMKAAVKKLQEDRQRFWAQSDVINSSMPDLVDRYVKTIGSSLAENLGLSTFANDCYDHLGWVGTCQAYEHILAEDLGDAHWMYHSWTFFGSALMKDAKNLSFEERVRIAADVQSVFERAAHDLGFYWNNTMGYFYYDHPLKAEQPQLYLLKSKEWFERAIENEDFNECDHHDLQTLGHVFYELGDFESALYWYKKFAAVEDRCGDACFLDRTLAKKRLAECEQRETELENH